MFEIQNTKENAHVFKHSKFGCTHLHLDCDSTEKAFSVAFRTIPKDHSGIAHILEHTVLCGSEKFPVRDPFERSIFYDDETLIKHFYECDDLSRYNCLPVCDTER